MPRPRKGESRQAFVKRAIPILKREHPGRDMKAILGKAYGMYAYYIKRKRRKRRK